MNKHYKSANGKLLLNTLSFSLPILIVLLSCVSSVKGQSGIISKRLDKLSGTIDMSYNGHVEESINEYLKNEGDATSIILGKSAVYLKSVEDSLKKNGLPVELKYLVPAISDYDLWKVSDDGGTGFWQLRYVTAKRFSLNISSYVDERRDFQKSTHAAMKHFKELNRVYNDWYLTIVAFYSDEVEVNKAIRMANGSKKYWDLHRFLPARFQNVVPDFIASAYTHAYYQMHNLKPVLFTPIPTEKVEVTQWTTIFQLSRALDVGFDTLKDLNAVYKKQVIPHTQKKYFVDIPFSKVGRFYEMGDSVYTFGIAKEEDSIKKPQETLTTQRPEVQEPEEKAQTATSSNGSKLLYYTVKKGDYLGRVADLYDVNISDLRRWNGIRGDRIDINQRLKIYVPAASYATYSKINGMSAYQKQQIINKD